MGSESDLDKMQQAAQVLEEMEVAYEIKILSAHRAPEQTASYARSARDRGLEVIICGAGMAAHLPGAVAAQTTLPVIGVPLASGALSGMDALYATVRCLPVFLWPLWPLTGQAMLAIWPVKSWPSGMRNWPCALRPAVRPLAKGCPRFQVNSKPGLIDKEGLKV